MAMAMLDEGSILVEGSSVLVEGGLLDGLSILEREALKSSAKEDATRALGITSTSVHGATMRTTASRVSVTDRLFQNEHKTKVTKTANDALLSSLPTDTLRWIKTRRKADSFEKVALTHFRERQLRAIFQGLDFDGMGTIHLDLVCDAADYAEEKLKPKRGKPVFTDVRGMFEAMDEDGDGTVDFHEFTIAMTGSSKSAIDKASEKDVENLTKRFIEYAMIRKRESALQKMATKTGTGDATQTQTHTITTGTHNRLSRSATSTSNVELPVLVESEPDLDKYTQFRTLFTIGVPADDETSVWRDAELAITGGGASKSTAAAASNTNTASATATGAGAGASTKATTATAASTTTDDSGASIGGSNKRTKSKTEALLERFYNEMDTIEKEQNPNPNTERRAKSKELQDVLTRVREARQKTEEEAASDPEIRELNMKIAEEKRYIAEMKKQPWLKTLPTTKAIPTTLIPYQATVKEQIKMRLVANKELKEIKTKRMLSNSKSGKGITLISLASMSTSTGFATKSSSLGRSLSSDAVHNP